MTSAFAETPLNVQSAFAGGLRSVNHIWGQANVSNTTTGVRINYPKGSIDPGNSPPYPLGGAGFEWHFAQGQLTGTLTYQVMFQSKFGFNKGGKLPGLFGGSDPRGCIQSTEDGFSARLMWRSGGAGELYLYSPGQGSICGQSIGRGSWYFTPGKWYTITEVVTMNSVGQSNGSIQVLVNGALKVNAQNLTLRNTATTQVDGFIFSTFFGGSDSTWASPQNQWAAFQDFTHS